jgi:hypothetical protein
VFDVLKGIKVFEPLKTPFGSVEGGTIANLYIL